jgi:hypothetical protein
MVLRGLPLSLPLNCTELLVPFRANGLGCCNKGEPDKTVRLALEPGLFTEVEELTNGAPDSSSLQTTISLLSGAILTPTMYPHPLTKIPL